MTEVLSDSLGLHRNCFRTRTPKQASAMGRLDGQAGQGRSAGAGQRPEHARRYQIEQDVDDPHQLERGRNARQHPPTGRSMALHNAQHRLQSRSPAILLHPRSETHRPLDSRPTGSSNSAHLLPPHRLSHPPFYVPSRLSDDRREQERELVRPAQGTLPGGHPDVAVDDCPYVLYGGRSACRCVEGVTLQRRCVY